MKINFINLSNVCGGQEIYLYNILKELQYKYGIRLFTQNSSFNQCHIKQLNNIEIVNLSTINYKQFNQLKRLILNNSSKDDIFIFNGNRAIYLGAMFPKYFKKLGIQHSSIIDIQDGVLKKNFRHTLYKLLLANYNELIGVSSNTIKPVAHNKKVSVIHNGIDHAFFQPISSDEKFELRKELGIKEDEKILLMVGTLTDNKGQFEALKIINMLDSRFKLILVGDGPEKESLIKFILEHGLQEKVLITGKISNVVDYYRVADVLLFLSKNEGLPLTILEAMAVGLPILTTNVGGISEVIIDGDNGFFINRGKTDENVNKIKHLFECDILLKKFEENNVRKIQDKFSLEKNIKLLEGKLHKYKEINY